MSQQGFQQEYRRGIAPGYSGYLHATAVLAIGAAVLGYSAVQLQSPSSWQWLTVLAALLIGNLLEYVAHRWLGHRRTRLLPLFYQRHSGDHHRFFTHLDMLWQSHRDWRVVLFPLYLILLVIVANAALGWGLAQLFGENLGWLWLMGTVSAYLLYEICHFTWHLPANHPLFRIRALDAMRERHRLHHHPKWMNRINFNITWPLTDWLLGTDSPREPGGPSSPIE
ncbi:sterol desaturase family protein [Ferrimonas sp.]|uniref:sterol desaturase family protein n=1 Tax=Ferrimonas sp. TaxID=2080861 RepID=UPI003A955F1C